MTTRIEQRWQALVPDPERPVFQLLDAAHPLRLYVGREMSGELLFLLVDRDKPPVTRSMRAVRISATPRDDGQWSLLLRLVQPELAGLFALLCEDLVSSCAELPAGASGMTYFVRRLGSWKRLLEDGQQGLLGPAEVRGLFAELWLLEQLFLPRWGESQGVAAWVGPYGADQDFRRAEHAWEIKSVQVDAPAVRVASERQLHSSERALRLLVLSLEELPGTDALTLNALVQRLRVRLRELPETSEALDERLTLVGYLVRPEYDTPAFRLGALRVFDVREGFPRITPADVAPGVHDVSYMISLDACGRFEMCDPFEGISE